MSHKTPDDFFVVFPDAQIRYKIRVINWMLVGAVWKQKTHGRERVLFT